MTEKQTLTASARFTPRFSEVDSMGIVWHGSYPLYLEDAREEFGKKYGIAYADILGNGYYAPLVELSFKYKRPIAYGTPCRVDIAYRPTEAAKIVFDYEIHHATTGELMACGRTVQVFTDMSHQLVWANPAFYYDWKKKWRVL